MKAWVKDLTNNAVNTAQNDQKVWFNQKIIEVRELFNVAGLMGPDESANPYADLSAFVESMHAHKRKCEQFRVNIFNPIEDLKLRIVDLNEILEKKMFVTDSEKAERKVLQQMAEKNQELREITRMDRNDINNKLSTFKADVSTATFGSHIHNFLKERVYMEWSSQVGRIKDLETELEEF